jgi:RNA polymerase sigma-70 factor (ECF subfamily)
MTESVCRGAIHWESEARERALLDACRRGDPDALSRLVEEQYDPLYRFLWRLTGSSDLAAELTQEAFVRALERLPSFAGRSRFSTWLHSIALNLWKDHCRKQPRESVCTLEAEGVGGEPEALALLERSEVRRAVQRLPEAQRVAILLFYFEELSHREIAQICGCPVGTIGTRHFHGLRTLRRLLGGSPPGAEPTPPQKRRGGEGPQ